MNYNTDKILWENTRKNAPDWTVKIWNGYVLDGSETVARFNNNTHAKETLLAAGWQEGKNFEIVGLHKEKQ